MKKKLIFALATGFFAAATVFNMNVLQGNSVGDVSLENIATMAQARDPENGGGNNNDDCTNCGSYDMLDCKFTVSYVSVDAQGNRVVLDRKVVRCSNCAYNCNFSEPGTCRTPVLCPTHQEVIVRR
ncbi:hypothetical protein [Alkalitalea saponilacus]|uniref:Uncharacterized protein n=1 Tax=Alkalitalea saponilacus TaxID=889453 RepID=A0A1T5GE86_9BACT|nr:hypothetical protein [Alkalitalea saponilacus]SKC06729.1 hypothetical protein SAMN03080601_01832 [Alkalitalea saponilacus]